jgi:putative membrane protein
MILPGISGSFILLILGAYKTLSDAIHDFNFKNIFIFIGGAIIGLLSFSRVLKWLFKNYENTTLAVLTGFIIGSLNVIWPWKQTLLVFSKKAGKEIPLTEITDLGSLSVYQKSIQNYESYNVILEKSISPFTYSKINNDIESQFVFAILFMIFGFLTILLLELFADKKPING